jgi:hypothetical protein
VTIAMCPAATTAPYLPGAPGACRAEASAANQAQPLVSSQDTDAARLTGTGLVRAEARANAASSHEHNQAGTAHTTAEAVAIQRLCAFTLIK